MKTLLAAILALPMLAASAHSALAQQTFVLPQECRERVVANPEKCVIQDGRPPLPRVHQPPQATPQPVPACAGAGREARLYTQALSGARVAAMRCQIAGHCAAMIMH